MLHEAPKFPCTHEGCTIGKRHFNIILIIGFTLNIIFEFCMSKYIHHDYFHDKKYLRLRSLALSLNVDYA